MINKIVWIITIFNQLLVKNVNATANITIKSCFVSRVFACMSESSIDALFLIRLILRIKG